MNVRLYRPSDLQQITEIYRVSIHSLAGSFYTAEQLNAWAPAQMDAGRWEKRLDSVHTIVAEEWGVLAGFASYELNGHLDLLFTHPGHARKGIATQLYRTIESTLAAGGISRVFTEASLAAKAFFDHHGFQVDREEVIDCRGVSLRRYAMHKQIDSSRVADKRSD